MNEVNEKNEIIKSMIGVEVYPVDDDANNIMKATKIPYSKITIFGTAFEPLVEAFQFLSNTGGSGLYKVTVPNGGHLAKFKDGSGNLGTVLDKKNKIVGQATMKPVVCNPTMLFMAVALASVDEKLDIIMETQQEMLDFLIQKEMSELRGDLSLLSDIINNYKFNWSNDMYKKNNHIKVLDIKQDAERKINFYREQIAKKISKKSFIHNDSDVKKQFEKIHDEFKEYQLALYLYSFATYLEVILLENFDSSYLECVVSKIEDYSYNYRVFYSECYNQIENHSKTSIESFILGRSASVNKAAGEVLTKIPAFEKTKVDKILLNTSSRLKKLSTKKTEQTMNQFSDNQNNAVLVFVEKINTIKSLYNKPLNIFIDSENMYFDSI